MPELHFPWLEFSILVPAIGAVFVKLLGRSELARNWAIGFSAVALILAIGESLDFLTLESFEAHDHWDLISLVFHQSIFVIDELSAPLLPLTALVYLVTIMSTLRTKLYRFSFAWTLAGEALTLATLSCRASWVLVCLLSVSAVGPWLEMRRRQCNTRVYELHMGLYVLLLFVGYGLLASRGNLNQPALLAGAILSAATLLRSGIVPVHCWMTDMFEKATFGTSLLFATPLVGAYAVMRLVLPIAPAWALHTIAIVSLITAIYAAGMALVQVDSRRFFCYLFLSNASLVLVGLELVTPIGLTGALCVWLSVSLSLSGFGLVIRSIEARIGRVSLVEFHGLYEQMPSLAGFFLLTGLASIGFPGTIGFVGMELLVEGAVAIYPTIGFAVVLAAALNGIAILKVYFRIFTGKRTVGEMTFRARWQERVAVLVLSLLIIGGGIAPQLGVQSRFHAAQELGEHRDASVLVIEQNSAAETTAAENQ
ncbi:MAG: oxidoreductase [Planctomycetales bacterium]|nr:oxidoreductase [Planctomycetales bacterium]